MGALTGQLKTRINLFRHRGRTGRRLEIGPGECPLQGFESVNVVDGRWVDYVLDAAGPLPFPENTFELIYASHVLEHVPWTHTAQALAEWVRILKPGGRLEVWVPDGLKISKAFVDAEMNENDDYRDDGWFRFNDAQDPCTWAAGRIFTYGNGDGNPSHPNWHRALFSPRRLAELLTEAGLTDVREMHRDEVRGADHGWINLGMTGRKPEVTP